MLCLFVQDDNVPYSCFFFFNDAAPTEIYTLSLHDALPIFAGRQVDDRHEGEDRPGPLGPLDPRAGPGDRVEDRKSTRLNSSHLGISYAVFCLKKKKKNSQLYIYHIENQESIHMHDYYDLVA